MSAQITRRQLIGATTALGGGALLTRLFPASFGAAYARVQQAAASVDPLAAARVQTAAAPIEALTLTDTLTMLSGPGGNVVVLNGPDGRIVVDTFVQGVWPALQQVLDAMSNAPITLAINTHWHFDHADNNESFRNAGAGILAHENTRRRLSEPHDLLGMHFDPAPVAARPTDTFTEARTMEANGERLDLGYIPPAHTDTDIYIHYTRANVLHMGDVFFNGMYPFIDASTGGSISGTIAGAERMLKMANATTKIVPGHGPLGDRAALTRYRDVLVDVRERVQTLKGAGRSLQDVVAAKPTADVDAVWGRGFMQPDDFVAIVYNTL
jgi:glyoxylase-like metal-dependent hydrolase (beta-lactamase superfamily II)